MPPHSGWLLLPAVGTEPATTATRIGSRAEPAEGLAYPAALDDSMAAALIVRIRGGLPPHSGRCLLTAAGAELADTATRIGSRARGQACSPTQPDADSSPLGQFCPTRSSSGAGRRRQRAARAGAHSTHPAHPSRSPTLGQTPLGSPQADGRLGPSLAGPNLPPPPRARAAGIRQVRARGLSGLEPRTTLVCEKP